MKRLTALVLCIVLLAGCGREPTQFDTTLRGLEKLLGTEGDLLTHQELLPAGNSLSDWLAMALTLGHTEAGQKQYLENLEAYVTTRYAAQGSLSDRKATEYHRIALTVKALGGNPRSFGTHADGTPVDLVAEGTWDYAGSLGEQGLNGLIFGLITLYSGDYGTEEQRQTILRELLEAQTAAGGFGLEKGTEDVDLTAMALQALAFTDCETEKAKAVDFLAGQMTDRGTFAAFGTESAESVCQVIIALCALGIDPAQDPRFCRNGSSPVTALEAFRLADGTYCHELTQPEGNLMATEQAMLALAALERQGTSIYDFSGK